MDDLGLLADPFARFGATLDPIEGSPTLAAWPDGIRRLRRSDLGDVAALFGRIFRKGGGADLPAVSAAIEALYLARAARPEDVGSLVHVGPGGRVDAFLGVFDVAMELGGRPVRCGVLGAFMADREAAPSVSGAALARALSRLPHDLFFSDTASPASLAIARALRYDHLALGSLTWFVPLRPAAAGARLVARRSRLAGKATEVVARAVDAVLPRLAPGLRPPAMPAGLTDRAMDRADFLLAAPALVRRHALRPTWQTSDLDWVLEQAERRTHPGRLQIREVRDAAGRRIGIYLIYSAPGAAALVLQVLALPRREGLVYGALLARAAAEGAVSVGGAASAEAVAGLSGRRGLVFRSGTNAIARTGDPEIARAIRAGDCCLGGLVGESWVSLVIEDFV